MQMGGAWDQRPFEEADVARAERLVGTALEQEINLFDHADIYTYGKSEAVFGEVLRRQPGLRDQIVLQTKCGIRFPDDPRPGDPGRYDFSYEHIVRSVAGSLKRLQTGQVDILLLHRPDTLVEPDEVARAFDELERSGQVRYFGVSNHTPGQIELLRRSVRQPLVVNQVELSLLHAPLINDGVVANQAPGAYQAAAGTLDYCRLNGITLQAWGPVATGRLIDPPARAEPRVRAAAKAVAEMAKAKGTSREAIALAWLLRHPAGIQPIVGTTKPARIIASCQADGVMLSREEWYRLFTAARGGAMP
jgi:predicted oxidoreductase